MKRRKNSQDWLTGELFNTNKNRACDASHVLSLAISFLLANLWRRRPHCEWSAASTAWVQLIFFFFLSSPSTSILSSAESRLREGCRGWGMWVKDGLVNNMWPTCFAKRFPVCTEVQSACLLIIVFIYVRRFAQSLPVCNLTSACPDLPRLHSCDAHIASARARAPLPPPHPTR